MSASLAAPADQSFSQSGPGGIRFDFNDGCRISVPPGAWHVVLRDLDTDTVLLSSPLSGGTVRSNKRYYVRFGIEIEKDGAPFFRHDMSLAGQEVHVSMRKGGIGDHLAWFGHVVAFARKHGCQVTCAIRPETIALFQPCYPDLTLVPDDADPSQFYASYKVLVFYNDAQFNHSPQDYRSAGLENNAALILGLPTASRRPDIAIAKGGRPIAEKYVCIAAQASSQSKYWNNPLGWIETVEFLKQHGYRVVCIDRERVNGSGTVWNHIPYGADDGTGALPLSERARWLRHAEFFIGLSSGLSWLAWAVNVPVVMISGFTIPANEFEAAGRVINWNTCTGCSNDIRCLLDISDFLWCPRHKGTERQFECTRQITSRQVINTIRAMPEFAGRPK